MTRDSYHNIYTLVATVPLYKTHAGHRASVPGWATDVPMTVIERLSR